MTDQKTPDGPQERLEGVSATPAPPEDPNEPQNGAQPRGPVDWARQQAAERAGNTVQTRREAEALKRAHVALAAQAGRDQATLARVRALAANLFVAGATDTHRNIGRQLLNALQPPVPGEDTAATEATAGCTSACEGTSGIRGLLEHVGIDTTGRDITVAGRVVDAAPAHNAGPSVREAAADDAAHWTTKYAGEGQ